ncbi:hypothetical protein R3X27_22805 [Tropicimonas sp. TH_r6]|uniref:hypothetical protein n=1 Tax=Tropicimonas sp. TH_r6 TaxID=3082085 RepID=UPI00295569B0|nr:hypothetical protein [Tropicimonas sp. TH_r6]MDV7145526.1 hypothetical protein [Tropicimonas sp. TH_r6]
MSNALTGLLTLPRRAFLSALSRLVVGLSPEETRARILALPLPEQVLLVLASGTALAVATQLFAYAGPGGPLALWLTLAVLLRQSS